MVNDKICKILEGCINDIYKEYLSTNNISSLAVIRDLIDVVTSNGMYFGDIMIDDVVNIHITNNQQESPSYFSTVRKLVAILMNEIKPATNIYIPPIKASKEKNKKKSKIVKKKVTKGVTKPRTRTRSGEEIKDKNKRAFKGLAITFSDFSEIDKSRLDIIDEQTKHIYQRCGYKDFLNGERIWYKFSPTSDLESGIVKRLYISRVNSLTFSVKTDVNINREWMLAKTYIKVNDETGPIPMLEYIIKTIGLGY